MRAWKITGVPGVARGVAATLTELALTPTITFPPNAAQPGVPDLIDTNDNSLLDAVWRSNNLWTAANSGCTWAGDATLRV